MDSEVDEIMRTKLYLIAALLFPIITLITMSAYKRHILHTGYEVILPVTGYDPRDILSGHYVTYTVDYGVNNYCDDKLKVYDGYMCLESHVFMLKPNSSCKHFIKGKCNYGRFEAGIEKYYIPEKNATTLDKQVRNNQASILISVTPEGHALVKDLLIDGKSWRKH